MMTKLVAAVYVAMMSALVVAQSNAHFVGDPTFTITGDTVSSSGKVAGLGNVDQIDVVLSATAECINGGGNHPRAVNKTSVNAEGIFPVQNGKALFSLSMEASFQPPCNPPMTVHWSNLSLNVTAADGTHLTFP